MKLIHLPHKVCDMTCMVNGLEDLYEWKTGQRLPDHLLFFVSGLGSGFTYLRNKNAPAPYMVNWGTTTQRQYEALGKLIGFTWQVTEGRSFPFSLKSAQRYIDQGQPIILGALDMYHLPYFPSFYHQLHIPIHYVLMVGYDEAQQAILVHDCGRAEVQTVPYRDLQPAWDVTIPGLCRKNSLFAFEFGQSLADTAAIARAGLHARACAMLNPPTAITGLKGMRRLARELPHWPQELDQAGLEASLRYLVEFTGNPPTPPTRLIGPGAPDNHAAGRDGFAKLLSQLAQEQHQSKWAEAGDLFDQSGRALTQLTDAVVDVILGESATLEPAAGLLTRIADMEERAFGLLYS